MSRVVKSIGRGIHKVVQGVAKFVKKVVNSKAVKFIAVAAAAYFTAGAALGAVGAASSGTSILSGAASGLGSAWGGLTGTFTGGGLSSLGAGLTQASAAGASGMGFQAAAAAISSGQTIGAATSVGGAGGGGASPVWQASGPLAAEQAPAQIAGNAATGGNASAPPPTKGIVAKAMEFLGTHGGGLAASTALKLAGGMMADRAQQKQYENELARITRNQNVGGINVNYGPSQAYLQTLQKPGMVAVPEFDPNKFKSGLVGGQFAPMG